MLIKKFIAAMAAISMLATSFVVMNVAADAAPAITASVISGDDTVSGSDIGVRFTFANIAENKLIKGFNFEISVPTTLKNPKNKSITSNTTLKATIQYDEDNEDNPFLDGWDAYYNASGNYKFIWTTDGTTRVGNSDWFNLEFKGADSYDDLAEGAFEVTVFAITQDNVTGALSLEKGQITVVDPTSAAPPAPADPWVSATQIGGLYEADEFVGDQSKAVAWVVSLPDPDEAQDAMTWKADFGGTTKGMVKNFAGSISGATKFGVIIKGVTAADDVTEVKAAWGDQTPSAE